MAEETVLDTSVLQKANAPITPGVRPGPRFAKRLALLQEIRQGTRIVLHSKKLVTEYKTHVKKPRIDYVKAFFEIITDPTKSIFNWPRWSGRHAEKARKCHYPAEDNHVLRTAMRPHRSTIIAEEVRMLTARACVYRAFRVRIRDI